MANPSLFKNQGSRLFLWGVLLAGVVLLLIAELWVKSANEPYYGILSHLASMVLAAFVAATMFAFRDVREMFSAALSTLLIDGEVVHHLSADRRRGLRDRLLLEDLRPRIQQLQPELRDHLESVQRTCMSTPHRHNFSATVTLEDDPENPELLKAHNLETYKVSARHCEDGKATFRLLVQAEQSNTSGDISEEMGLGKFCVAVGDQEFGRNAARVERTKSGGLDIIKISFDREIEVDKEVSIRVEYETMCSKNDPTEIRGVRYPTIGFRCSLFYKAGLVYDAAWFKTLAKGPDTKDLWGRDDIEITPTGVSATSNQWLIPGDGVVLYWFPEPQRETTSA